MITVLSNRAGGFTPDGIAKAKTRKRSFRMHDDTVFAENVRSMYEEVDSERDEHGGWAIGHLAWPSSNATRARRTVCEIDELDPTALTPQQLQVHRGHVLSYCNTLA